MDDAEMRRFAAWWAQPNTPVKCPQSEALQIWQAAIDTFGPKLAEDKPPEWHRCSTDEALAILQRGIVGTVAPDAELDILVMLLRAEPNDGYDTEAADAITALRAALAESERERNLLDADAAERLRKRGAYWLSEEGRAELKQSFDDANDGNAVRPLLDALESAEQAKQIAEQKVAEQQALLNTPETRDFWRGAQLEAAHQIQRWGDDHDRDKEPQDWFWTLGYLGGKALNSVKAGDEEKARHHMITSAALLANWFRHCFGEGPMIAGLSAPTDRIDSAISAQLSGEER